MSKKSTQNIRMKESYAYLKSLHAGIGELIGYQEFKMAWGSQVARIPTIKGRQQYISGISNKDVYNVARTSADLTGRSFKTGAAVSPKRISFLMGRGATVSDIVKREFVMSNAQAKMLKNIQKDFRSWYSKKDSTKGDALSEAIIGDENSISTKSPYSDKFLDRARYLINSKTARKEYERTKPDDIKAESREIAKERKALREKYDVKKGEKQKQYLERFSPEDRLRYQNLKLSEEKRNRRTKIINELKQTVEEGLTSDLSEGELALGFMYYASESDFLKINQEEFGALMDILRTAGLTDEDFANIYSPKEQQV